MSPDLGSPPQGISQDLKKFLEDAPWYASADSVPEAFAVPRPAWIVFAFLLTFAALVALLLQYGAGIQEAYTTALTTLVGRSMAQGVLPVRLRLMFLSFLTAFPFFLTGPLVCRAWLAIGSTAAFILASSMIDAATVASGAADRMATLLNLGNFLVGLAAMGIFGVSMLLACTLPRNQTVLALRRNTWPGVRILLLAGVLAFLGAHLIVRFGSDVLHLLRSVGLLGGIGPGVVLFMPLFTAVLALIGIRAARPPRGAETNSVTTPIAVLVPAYNERRGIAACIMHLDAAAARYAAVCTLYLVDNGSRDDTVRLAREALARCTHLQGDVLICRYPGKSKALNYGLARIAEDVVVRVDADTLVSPTVFHDAMQHFGDPTVGAVGGVPLPLHEKSLISRLRAIEVYLAHGYARLGMGAIDGLMSLPGIFTAYRRDCLIALGGFAEGMNGEDSDIVFRIGRLGFRLINDPRIVVYSEVPESYAHLREQRLRWFRSTFHVAAKNRSAFRMRQGMRGVWSLPWAIVQASRRAMIIPILIYALLVAWIEPGALQLRNGAAVLAVLVGSPFVVAVIVLLAYRRYRLLLDLPAYVGFRLLRAFFTLETLFTLPLKPVRAKRVRVRTLSAPPST